MKKILLALLAMPRIALAHPADGIGVFNHIGNLHVLDHLLIIIAIGTLMSTMTRKMQWTAKLLVVGTGMILAGFLSSVIL